jgi:hypothetical protein
MPALVMRVIRRAMAKTRPTTPNKKTVRVHFVATVKFSRILSGLRKLYEAAPENESLVVPYVITCAATLEARLNDALADYGHRRWGWNEKTLTQSLLSMSFRGKLNALVPLLTDHRYQFNRNHYVYQRLNSLISVRNLLVHPKPFEREIPMPDIPHPLGYVIPDGYYDIADDLTFGAVERFTPIEYHDALEKLDKWFFNRLPDRISKVALFVQNEYA